MNLGFLNSAHCGSDAEILAKRFPDEKACIRSVSHSCPPELKRHYGISTKAANLISSLPSLSRLILLERFEEKPKLDTFEKQAMYSASLLFDRDREFVVAIFLDAKYCVIESVILAEGTVNEAPVYPREILRAALDQEASYVLITHNHPSGSHVPTKADLSSTDAVKAALETVDIRLLDHIVVGTDSAYGILSGTTPVRLPSYYQPEL